MGFSVDVSVSAVTVFLQGLLSFFSPCVLPLLPLYMGYLSGGTGTMGEDGRIHYERRKVMIHTLCFVIGVSSAFFLLGFGFSALGGLLKSGKQLFSIAGGLLMIVMGLLMVTGRMNDVSGYLSSLSAKGGNVRQEGQEAGEIPETEAETGSQKKASEASEAPMESSEEAAKEPVVIPAVDFTLQDQFGNTHSLSDYEGKTIFLNFWATWCPPCKAEMPDIQKLYENAETEGENALVVLGVATPGLGGEQSQEGVTAFLEEKGYTYPVLMDTTGELTMAYGISSYPTTFMIDRDGNVFGYISGQLSLEMMEDIVAQTLEGKRREE